MGDCVPLPIKKACSLSKKRVHLRKAVKLEKSMKKTVFTVLIICLILSFSACNRAEESSAPLSEESVPAGSAREESTPEESTPEESAPETVAPSMTEEEGERQTKPDPLPIESTFFPDAVFLNYVKDHADSDHDGFLCKEELEAVTEVDLFMEERLASVSGIEFFPNLVKLTCCSTGLTSLDLSNNTALEYLNCGLCHIREIDLAGCTDLKVLHCELNELHTTDVSGLPVLEDLWCEVDDLSELDLSHNPALRELRISGKTGQIDLSHNPELSVLQIDPIDGPDAGFLSALNVSHNPKLFFMQLADSRLPSLDLSGNPELKTLYIISDPELKELDVSNNPMLENLQCHGGGLTSLNISGTPLLEDLDVSCNSLTQIDLSGHPRLRSFSCAQNRLDSLDISSCPELKSLDCSGNRLTSLDLSENVNLGYLYAFGNSLSELRVEGIEAFRNLEETRTEEDGIDTYCREVGFDSFVTIKCDASSKVVF